jgi:hypothetical protein
MNMKKILKLWLLCSSLLLATEGTTSYGIGLGQLYNGVGINIASHETSSMKSIAFGCMDIAYGTYSGFNASCGFSIAYVSTRIFEENNNHHGLGVHVGITKDSDAFAGSVGVGYSYFFDEIANKGLNIGLTPTL